jgi:M6 family metalloprotease-like protein
MQRYPLDEFMALGAAAALAPRLDFAKEIGNYRAHPDRFRQAITRTARQYLEEQGLATDDLDRMMRLAAPPPAWRGLPTTGNVKIFALLIDFSDNVHTNSETTINDRLFGTPATGAPYDSLAAYYRRASYNKLNFSGTTLGWYRAGARRADVAQTTAGREGLIKEALQHFNAAGHNFSQYDNDHNGVIDYFMVFWSGPDNGWANFWWGYQTSFNDTSFRLDGVGLRDYSWQWEGRPVGSAFSPMVPIHETGHALGLPDLYDYDGSVGPTGGVGGLDIMDANWGDHNCFHKWMLDWLTPTVISDGKHVLTLGPVENTGQCVALWPGLSTGNIFSELFMVENRQRLANDVTYPGSGLLIWHVDARLNSSGMDFEFNNSYSAHKFVRLMEADGLEQIEANGMANAGDYYVPGKTFGATGVPSSAMYGGQPSCVSVYNILTTPPQVTATFEAARLPIVYQHNDYQGNCQVLDAGRYDVRQLSIGNDVISSVRVPPGWRVTLYQHAGFAGATRVLTADTPALTGFNDATSSIIVQRAFVVVYEHNNYQGRYQVLDAGRYDLGQLTIGNDVISSVKVPPGMRVILYQHANFGVPAKVLTADTPALPDFNDQTSSIVVARTWPVVYEHNDYQGRYQVLDAGRYDLGQLTIGNDVISSVQVPVGWRVTLYQHAGFVGATKVLTANTPALPDFNDQTSSIVVEKLFAAPDVAGEELPEPAPLLQPE